MIKAFVADLAAQMGVNLSGISIIDGCTVGCLDSYLLNLSSDSHLVNVLIYQSELDHLQSGSNSERLEAKIRTALSRLQMLLEK